MKAFRKLCITITAVFVLLAAVLNVCLLRTDNSSGIYRVEVKRLTDEITQTGSYDLSQYPHLTGVFTGDTCTPPMSRMSSLMGTIRSIVWNIRPKIIITI